MYKCTHIWAKVGRWGIKWTTRGAVFSPHSTTPFQGLRAFTFHIILRLLLHSLYKETAMLFICHALMPHPILLPVYHLVFLCILSLHAIMVKFLIFPISQFHFFIIHCFFSLLTLPTNLAAQIYMRPVPLFFSPQFLPFSLLAAQSPPHSCLSCGHPQ